MAIKFNNTIFVHIPKCGGSSLGRLYKDGILDKDAHLPINRLERFGAKEYIVNVRNPYDRFHSHYHFLIEWDEKRSDGLLPLKGRTKLFYIARREKLKLMGFDGFINCLVDENDRRMLMNSYYIPHPWKLQTSWFENQTDKPVKTFKLEDGGCFPYLKELGYNKEPIVEKKSKLKTPYTQEQKDIVYEYFKYDFERLGYER